MDRRLTREEGMAIKVLAERGVPKRAIARQLGVAESSVRYRLAREASGAIDGRSRQRHAVEPWAEAIAVWMERAGGRRNGAALHAWLVAEHGYAGSLRSVQRFVGRRYPPPRLRTRRRVETPPGALGQVDWSHWPRVAIGGEAVDLVALHLVLAWSRMEAVVWSRRKHLLAWLGAHNEAFRRIGGVVAVLRMDNERTVMKRGAGPSGEVHPAYAAYARALRFHIDVARPYAPRDKGKVERRIGDDRGWLDPQGRPWRDLAELQAWTDARGTERAHRRRCPATGTSVWEAFEAEQTQLAPLPPALPAPFDLVGQRRVAIDATVRFEGRTYSVPFAYAGREIELRGCTQTVQAWADGTLIAEHPRHTAARLLIDPAHYDGPSTARVEAPVPLGRMGRRLVEIGALPPERRPIDLYAALAEAAR